MTAGRHPGGGRSSAGPRPRTRRDGPGQPATAPPDELVAAMPFAVTTGVVLDAVTPAGVTGHLDWHANRCTVGGLLHGGALVTLADSVGAVLAFLLLPDDATGTATVETKTNFVGPVRQGRADASAVPVHAGRSFVVVQTEVRAAGRLVALTIQTQAVQRPG